ncbi:transglutaminase domain-containing protein, partial [Tahibacter harae]|nr:Ig-like domain-containing protein [Tahibacter harae]
MAAGGASVALIPAAQAAELQTLLAAGITEDAAPILGTQLPVHRPRLPAREPLLQPVVLPSYADTAEVPVQAADYAASRDAPLSPAILAKAQSLGNDYTRIVDFVRSSVRTQWYAGSQQGAEGTLRTLAGNDVDQASLLIALLRASRAPARYVRGVLEIRSADLAASLGVREDKIGLALAAAGVAHRPLLRGGRIDAYAVEQVFVSAKIPYSHYRGSSADRSGAAWIALAPALKPHQVIPAGGALARTGLDAQAFLDEVLAHTQSEAPLTLLRQTLESRLAALTPPLAYADQLGRHTVAAPALELLPASLPAATVAITGEFAELPDTLRQQARIVLRAGTAEDAPIVLDAQLALADVADRRITLAYQPASIADGAVVDAYGGMSLTPPYLYAVRPVLSIDGLVVRQGGAAGGTQGGHAFPAAAVRPVSNTTGPVVRQRSDGSTEGSQNTDASNDSEVLNASNTANALAESKAASNAHTTTTASAPHPFTANTSSTVTTANTSSLLGSGALDAGTTQRLDITLHGPGGSVSFSQQLDAGGYAALILDAQASRPPQQDEADSLTGDSEPAAARLLANLGARYLAEWDAADDELAQLFGVGVIRPFPSAALVLNQYRVPRLAGLAQELNWRGVALDAALRPVEAFAQGASNAVERDWTALSALQGSSLEHRVFEQQWRVDSLSADKALQLARERGEPIETLTPATGIGTLNHPPAVLAAVQGWLARGYVVDIPRHPLTLQAWTGSAWRARHLASGEAGYFLSGTLAGGSTVPPPEYWFLQQLVQLLGNPYALLANNDPLAGALLVIDRDSQYQEAIAGQALANPLRVSVLDRAGRPVKGAAVRFRVTSGNGTLAGGGSSATVKTDSNGHARLGFTTNARIVAPLRYRQNAQDAWPNRTGANEIEVSAMGANGLLVSGEPLHAYSVPGPGVRLDLNHTDNETIIGGLGYLDLGLRALDANDNPVANLPLRLRVDTEVLPVTEECTVASNPIDATLALAEQCPAGEFQLTGHPCTSKVLDDLFTNGELTPFRLVPGNLARPARYTVHAMAEGLSERRIIRNDFRDCDERGPGVLLWVPQDYQQVGGIRALQVPAAAAPGDLFPVTPRFLTYELHSTQPGITYWAPYILPTGITPLLQNFVGGTPENLRTAPYSNEYQFDLRAGDTPGKITSTIHHQMAHIDATVHWGWSVQVRAPQISPATLPLTASGTTTERLTLTADFSPADYYATSLRLQLRGDGQLVDECALPGGLSGSSCYLSRGLALDRRKTYDVVTVLNDGTPYRLQSPPKALPLTQGIIGGYGLLRAGNDPISVAGLVQGRYPTLMTQQRSIDIAASYACSQGQRLAYLLSQPATVSLKFYHRVGGSGPSNTALAWTALDNAAQDLGAHEVLIEPRDLPLGEYQFELIARTPDGQEETREGIV